MIKKTNAFRDEKCTCKCGNTHEFYGGIGHTSIECIASEKTYIHITRCNKCNEISEFKDTE